VSNSKKQSITFKTLEFTYTAENFTPFFGILKDKPFAVKFTSGSVILKEVQLGLYFFG
jgi:hypothetical protein